MELEKRPKRREYSKGDEDSSPNHINTLDNHVRYIDIKWWTLPSISMFENPAKHIQFICLCHMWHFSPSTDLHICPHIVHHRGSKNIVKAICADSFRRCLCLSGQYGWFRNFWYHHGTNIFSHFYPGQFARSEYETHWLLRSYFCLYLRHVRLTLFCSL